MELQLLQTPDQVDSAYIYNNARVNCIIARTIKHDQWSDIPVVMFHQFVAMSEHP